MAGAKMFRYTETIGFPEVLAYINELHPNLKRQRIKAVAKVLYGNLFHGACQGFLSLDFVCTKGHDIKMCRCTGEEFRGEWGHDRTASVVAETWHIGVKSLVNLKKEQIDRFQVQTAGHIRDFVDYISKRSRR